MRNINCLKIFLLLFLTATIANAQPPQGVNMDKIQQQIKAAQALLNKSLSPEQQKQIQQAIQNARQQIKKVGVKNANGKDVTDSVVNAIQMPDPSKVINGIGAELAANSAKLAQLQQANHQAISKGLPQKGASSFSALPDAQQPLIVGYARAIITAVIPRLNMMNGALKKSLDDVLKDSTITPQAQGMQLLTAGAPLEVVEYMVATGVVKQPSNPWAANALGVLMRSNGRYKEAVQCFKYAYWINSCMLIKTNLAWAIAYYGDFITAKKYFNEVLRILPGYNSALEGLGMIAYQEGDTATLFQCLGAQLNVTGLGGPDDGPSDSFASFCGGVRMEQNMQNVGKPKAANSTPPPPYTGNTGDNGVNQDPPPTADSEYPTYPKMGGIFAQSIDGLLNAMQNTVSFQQSIAAEKQKSANNLAAVFSSLSKMDERTYTDDQGLKVTPFHYSKFVDEFHSVQAEFGGRVSYVMKQYYDEYIKLVNSIAAEAIQFHNDYIAALRTCDGKDSSCMNALNCVWKKKARTLIGSEFSGASASFSTHFTQLVDQINWYIDASTPSIRRMHKPDWNHYLNATRRDDINQAVLNMYASWITIQTAICQPEQITLMFVPANCTTELRSMNNDGGAGPKPTETELKKFETPPIPCEKMFNMDKDYTYASIHRDCDGTRVAIYPIVADAGGSIEAGPLKGTAEAKARLGLVMQTTAKNGQTRLGTTANVSAEVSLGVAVKDGDDFTRSKAAASAGASAKVDINYDSTIIIGSDGSIIGRAKSANFEASLEAHADAGISNPLGAVKANADWKAEAKGQIDVTAIAGSQNTYNVNSANFQASQSSGSSVHLPGQ